MTEYRIILRKTKGKKIFLDPKGAEGIYLYPGEVKKNRLSDGGVISDSLLEELRRVYAIPRAKKRALGILVKQDKTTHELREKLLASLHDSVSVSEAIDFVTRAGYIDDSRYAQEYLNSRRSRKSFRAIRLELSRKGIPADILDSVFESAGVQEREDVDTAVRKYIRRFPDLDYTAFAKTCAHFYRKGYDHELIRDALEEIISEDDGQHID